MRTSIKGPLAVIALTGLPGGGASYDDGGRAARATMRAGQQ
jgi:hypothetical protein